MHQPLAVLMKTLFKHIALVIIIASFCQCGEDVELKKNLIGDWKEINGYNVFSFNDSTCTYLNKPEFVNYKIAHDTIYCSPTKIDKKKYDIIKFYIAKLNLDTLIINYSRPPIKHISTKLLRCKNQLGYKVVVDSIYIESSGGSSQINRITEMKISSTGRVRISRLWLPRFPEGTFTGQLSNKQREMLNTKFRNIDYEEIVPEPSPLGCFLLSFTIEIYFKYMGDDITKKIRVIRPFSYEQPQEFLLFVYYILSLSKNVELQNIE